MAPQQIPSTVPSSALPRRYQAVRDRQQQQRTRFRPDTRCPSLDGLQGLELSMHLPARPNANRFEPLASTSQPFRFNRNNAAPRDYQRYPRRGRGSKEAKRRRDARRNRRKLAAVHMLDQQLSSDIDRTLTQANIRPLTRVYMPPPAPNDATSRLLSPQPMQVPRMPPSLPPIDTGKMNLMDELLQIQAEKCTLTLPPTPPLLPQIPSWCPTLPAFTNSNANRNELPLSFDLSQLPEPIEPLKAKLEPRCQELQLWRPKQSPQPKKQQHIFSPPEWASSNVSTCQTQQTGCKLYQADTGSVDVRPEQSEDIMEVIKRAVRAAERTKQKKRDEQSKAYPANLWRILQAPGNDAPSHMFDSKSENASKEPARHVFDATYELLDHRLEAVDLPAELDDTELPFVHANSLTGYSNERAQYPMKGSEGTVIYEAPARRQDQDDGYAGLNEMAVDPWMENAYADGILSAAISTPLPPSPLDEIEALAPAHGLDDIIPSLDEMMVDSCIEENYADAILALMDLPPLPPSPLPKSASIAIQPLSMAAHHDDTDVGSQTVSSNHIDIKQALPETPAAPISPAEQDPAKLELIPTESHTIDCWCEDCSEPPELIACDTMTEDDGWMVYSETGLLSPLSEWELEWGTFLDGEDDVDDKRRPHAQAATRDDSPKPSSIAHRSW